MEEDGLVFVLKKLCNEIWQTGMVLSVWKDRVIAKVPPQKIIIRRKLCIVMLVAGSEGESY